MKRYRIRLSRTVVEFADVEVEAETEEEAVDCGFLMKDEVSWGESKRGSEETITVDDVEVK